MIISLTGNVVFACHCKVAGDRIIAGLLVLDEDFSPGIHELWDAEDNRYWLDVAGTPSSCNYNVEIRCVDASF